MKIQTLEYFIATAETGSINEAAKKLYISQPSLTKSLQLMEHELNTTLFFRHKSGVELTPEGKRILPEAIQVCKYYQGWKNLSLVTDVKELKIYCHVSLVGFLIPDIVLHFRDLYPELKINSLLDIHPEKQILEEKKKPSIALSICSESEYQELLHSDDMIPFVLADGYYGCLVSSKNPMTKKGSVTTDDLKNHYLAVPPNALTDSSDTTDLNTSFLAEFIPSLAKSITPSRILQVESVSSVIDLVSERPDIYALSFSPAHLRYSGSKHGELVNIRIDDPCTSGKLCLIYTEKACTKYPIISELLDAIRGDFRMFMDHNGKTITPMSL